MNKIKFVALALLFATAACNNTTEEKSITISDKGKVEMYKNFESKYVDTRNVEVFLPLGYNANSSEKYKVLYIHDGQNVFNPETSYTGVDWGVDEAIDSLMKAGKIKNTIVIAPWNTPKRFVEYMPKSPSELTESQEMKDELKKKYGYDNLYSDEYLKFLVEELKPFIDSTYNTYTDMANTSIMGSSMGGLISLYAICEYPDVFGSAGCISTHWPVEVLGEAYMANLPSSLPSPSNHKIYFDYGTKTLDSIYEPYQDRVDVMMIEKGYVKEHNWETKKFEGASHSEESWKARIHIPLEFLLD